MKRTACPSSIGSFSESSGVILTLLLLAIIVSSLLQQLLGGTPLYDCSYQYKKVKEPSKTSTASEASPLPPASEASPPPPASEASPPPPPPRAYPYAGARYSNGTWGYVADPLRIRRRLIDQYYEGTNPVRRETPSLTYLPLEAVHEKLLVCGLEPGLAQEKPAGWDLLSRIAVDDPTAPVSADSTESDTKPGRPAASKSRLLCVLDTTHKHHYLLRAVVETWAWRCDGFLPASSMTVDDPSEPAFGAVDIPSENGAQKLQSILVYIYNNYLNDYDYVYVAQTGAHVIVENLRKLIRDLESGVGIPDSVDEKKPIYTGELFLAGSGMYYAGHGPGFLLNKAAVTAFVEQALPGPGCQTPHGPEKVFAKSGKTADGPARGRPFAICLAKIGVKPLESEDALGRLRFHYILPAHLACSDGRRNKKDSTFELWAGGRNFSSPLSLVSTETVAFSPFMSPVRMKRHHALLYKSCPSGTVLGDALNHGDASYYVAS